MIRHTGSAAAIDTSTRPKLAATSGLTLLAARLTFDAADIRTGVRYRRNRRDQFIEQAQCRPCVRDIRRCIGSRNDRNRLMTHTQMVHVPFKAATVAIADLTAGRVHLMADNINSIGPHAKAARLRGLGVTSAKRVAAFSELPTIAEAGVPGFDVSAWAGVIVPAGVPRTVIARLNAAVNTALAAPAVSDKLPELGLQVVGGTPEQFVAHIRKEAARWTDVVKRSGANVD